MQKSGFASARTLTPRMRTLQLLRSTPQDIMYIENMQKGVIKTSIGCMHHSTQNPCFWHFLCAVQKSALFDPFFDGSRPITFAIRTSRILFRAL